MKRNFCTTTTATTTYKSKSQTQRIVALVCIP